MSIRLIDCIKKKISKRKERKAILKKVSLKDGIITINADIIVEGKIIGKQ